MGSVCLWLAAILTILITLAHVFLGGPVVVDALFSSQDLPENAVWLAYFTWHDGTVVLPICAIAFALAARNTGQLAVGIFAATIVSGIGLLGLGTALLGGAPLWGTPAPYAFNLIGLVAWAGILIRSRRAS